MNLLLAVLLVVASPQNDTIQSGKKPAAAQQQQRGSDSLPVAVKLLNTGKSEHEAAQEADRIKVEHGLATSTLIWTRALGIATIILALGTLALYWDAREKGRRELRAYVFIDVIRPTEPTPIAALSPYGVVVKNSGKTPAYNVVIRSTLVLGPPKVTEKWPDPIAAPDESKGPLAPGGTVAHMTTGRAWKPEERAELAKGAVMYFYGVIHYEDVFGRKQWTRFRHERMAGTHELSACEAGNDAKRG